MIFFFNKFWLNALENENRKVPLTERRTKTAKVPSLEGEFPPNTFAPQFFLKNHKELF